MNTFRETRIRKLEAEQGAAWKYKSICASAVAGYFGALSTTRYLHTMNDLVRAIRKAGYTVRSRKSSIPKNCTIGKLRKHLAKLGEGDYIVRVKNHVLVMDHTGWTAIDTDPRKHDRRKVTHLYKVFKK